MASPDITFIKGQGGLGTPAAGQDFISGMVFYTGSLPSGFSSTNRIQKVFQASDAEALGVLGDYSDETKATGSYLVTAAGSTGDIVPVTVVEFGKTVLLANYVRPSTDTSVNLIAIGVAAAINLGTLVHGYSAVVTTATVTITARIGLGVFLNAGTPIVIPVTGTIAGTITQFAGGIASKLAVYRYHIGEYFRINPTGKLYLGFFAIPGTFDGSEISTMQNFAVGEIRQIGVYYEAVAFATSQIQSLQTQVTILAGLHMPISSVIYAADIKATALSSLTDITTLNSPQVSLAIGQDGAAVGNSLFYAYGKSITNMGAVLGATSSASVSESIAWISRFNLSNGIELDTAAFANGTLYRNTSASLLATLDTYKYIFLIKKTGQSGTWVNNSHTAVLNTSDYCKIERNRTIDKAIRNVYANMLPSLNSPLVLNGDGTLTSTTVAFFESLGQTPLDQMQRDQDLSAGKSFIDPTQNVLSTSTLYVTLKLVPVGVANQIIIKIGFVTSV